VVAVIYSLPGSQPSSPLNIRPVHEGRLPAHQTIHAIDGADALAQAGMYVAVLTPPGVTAGEIHYIAPVNDPRNVRGESLNPGSSAVLTRESGGTYSVRVPFIASAVVVGFEVGPPGIVSSVQYYLPLAVPPPLPGGFHFDAEHD
jgi:hypothetical protein